MKSGIFTYNFTKTSETGTKDFDFADAKIGVTGYKTIHVADPMAPTPEWPKTAADTDAPQTFTYSKSFAGVGGKCTDYDNTATITETEQTASQKVTVCVGLDLTVAKTAAGTFDRTYLWEITKDVDKTTVNIAEDGTATFNYTVNVPSQTGVHRLGLDADRQDHGDQPERLGGHHPDRAVDLAGVGLDLHGRRRGQHR